MPGMVQIHTQMKKLVYPSCSCIQPAGIPGIIMLSAINPVPMA